jgi:hypothetical protein
MSMSGAITSDRSIDRKQIQATEIEYDTASIEGRIAITQVNAEVAYSWDHNLFGWRVY